MLRLKAANCPIKIPRINLTNPGVVAAQNSLGLRFLNGIGVVKIVVSVYWLTKASDNDCANSANHLGVLFM